MSTQSGSKIDKRAMCDAIWHFKFNKMDFMMYLILLIVYIDVFVCLFVLLSSNLSPRKFGNCLTAQNSVHKGRQTHNVWEN